MSESPRSPPGFRGRGALSNPAGRFEPRQTQAVDDGWYLEPPPDSVPTVVLPDAVRRIITYNDSPDIGFDRSINPYRGCEHGCIYCYARPTHGYLGLSSGIDFETKLFYKPDAGAALEAELAAPRYQCRHIMLGGNTDPYQPVERRLGVTRAVLEVLTATRHPVAVITKGSLVLRDLDLLAELARDGLAEVTLSITTLDAETKRLLEPRTPSGAARLRVLRELRAAGVPAGVLVAPVIPAVNDAEMEAILAAAAEAGALWAGYVPLRLPHDVKDLFREWLATHLPDRASHVMSLVNDMRGGRDNDARFGTRMQGQGPVADLLRDRFRMACRRAGLEADHWRKPMRTDLFTPPAVRGPQMGFGF